MGSFSLSIAHLQSTAPLWVQGSWTHEFRVAELNTNSYGIRDPSSSPQLFKPKCQHMSEWDFSYFSPQLLSHSSWRRENTSLTELCSDYRPMRKSCCLVLSHLALESFVTEPQRLEHQQRIWPNWVSADFSICWHRASEPQNRSWTSVFQTPKLLPFPPCSMDRCVSFQWKLTISHFPLWCPAQCSLNV